MIRWLAILALVVAIPAEAQVFKPGKSSGSSSSGSTSAKKSSAKKSSAKKSSKKSGKKSATKKAPDDTPKVDPDYVKIIDDDDE